MAKPEKQLSALERVIAQAIGDHRSLGGADDPAREKYPQLWAWLSTVYVGRDSVKNPAYLSVRLGPEGVLASLVDRDLSVAVEITASRLEDVLGALESALTGPAPPIKSWGRKEPHLRKRKASG
jgi:hypothetical protein